MPDLSASLLSRIYAKTAEGQSSSTYHTFLVVICNELIGRPIVEPARRVVSIAR